MTKKERIEKITELLDQNYGTDIICYLDYETPWQLLFATILSAQCTDARVNLVTKDLFRDYPNLQAFANASQAEMEEAVRSTGFYHNKAQNLIACAKKLLERFGGEVPSSIEELTSLPGVGRKTANVMRGNIFHIDSIVVDTHVKRVSKMLGLTKEDDPEKVEFDLMKCLPKDHWILYNLQIIAHGRAVCIARRPQCENCCLKEYCKSYKK